MDFSYKEKSLLVSLAITVVVFGMYFFTIFSNNLLESGGNLDIWDVIKPVVLVIILESIMQALLAGRGHEMTDERDLLIEKTAYKYAYWVLSAGVFLLIVQLLIAGTFDRGDIFSSMGTVGLANVILLLFILAELTSFITQLVYYRRGV